MRPSARKAETKTPSTETSSSMMRESAGLGDHHVVQHVGGRRRGGRGGARPRAAGGAPRARSGPSSTPVERRVELGERDLGQEAEAAEVHAQDRDRACSSRRLAASSVPSPPSTTSASAGRATSRPEATRQSSVLARPASAAVASSSGAHAARASQATRSRTAAARLAQVGSRQDPDRLHAETACSQRRMRARRPRAARRAGARCRKNSRLPSAPVIGEAQRRAPRSPRAWATAATSRERLEVQGRVAARSRRGPPGAGPPRTAASPAPARRRPGASTRAAAGRILRDGDERHVHHREPHGSGTSSGDSARAFVRSRTTTRGSWRSRSWSWPRPTSIA